MKLEEFEDTTSGEKSKDPVREIAEGFPKLSPNGERLFMAILTGMVSGELDFHSWKPDAAEREEARALVLKDAAARNHHLCHALRDNPDPTKAIQHYFAETCYYPGTDAGELKPLMIRALGIKTTS